MLYRVESSGHILAIPTRVSYLITGQLEACGKLLRHIGDQNDRVALEQEIRELKMALDLMT